MASALKHNFKDAAVALIRGAWANRVARFCSYLIGEDGIDVTLVENPEPNAPNRIRLNARTAAPRIYNAMLDLGIEFGGNDPAAESTTTMTGSDADTSPPIALQTDTWEVDRETNPELSLQMPTRIVKSGPYHYVFYRTFKYSTRGRLKSVSAEQGFVRILA